MKKILALIFTLAVASSLSLPVYAKATSSTAKQTTSTKLAKKHHHNKGAKRAKKSVPAPVPSSPK